MEESTIPGRFERLDLEQLEAHLETTYFGRGQRLLYLPTVASTNTYAMQLVRNGSEEGVVVLTDSQTAGKGRQGRSWVDRPGCNALSSTILRPLFPPYLLVMIASLAVVEAIAGISTLPARIKWPNDVLIADRKVAGILIETCTTSTGIFNAVVGIGVNIHGDRTDIFKDAARRVPQEPVTYGAEATTLETEYGRPVRREIFLARLLSRLESMYLLLQQEAQGSIGTSYGSAFQLIQKQWREHLTTLGRTIEVRQGNTILSGVAEDVDGQGELFLRQPSGTRVKITWGDIGYPHNVTDTDDVR